MASQVLVRRISRPTRASLDYAAYTQLHECGSASRPGHGRDKGKRPSTTNPFGGMLLADSLTGSVARTALQRRRARAPTGASAVGRTSGVRKG